MAVCIRLVFNQFVFNISELFRGSDSVASSVEKKTIYKIQAARETTTIKATTMMSMYSVEVCPFRAIFYINSI